VNKDQIKGAEPGKSAIRFEHPCRSRLSQLSAPVEVSWSFEEWLRQGYQTSSWGKRWRHTALSVRLKETPDTVQMSFEPSSHAEKRVWKKSMGHSFAVVAAVII
jgi:hypothetical protein